MTLSFLILVFPFKFKCSITLSKVFKYHSEFKSEMLFVGEGKIRSTEKINHEPFLILLLLLVLVVACSVPV